MCLQQLHNTQGQEKKVIKNCIGPLQVKAVLDKSHYLLADWHGKYLLIFGAVHIHRLKPCYCNLGNMKNMVLAIVSNIQGLQNELEAFEPP